MGSFASSNFRELSVASTSNDGEPWRIPVEEHDKRCACKKPAVQRTSWTKPNPARRFWNCKNSLTKCPKCKWFQWKDEEIDEGYYKDKLYEMRKDMEKKDKLLAKKIMNSDVVALQKHVKELELMIVQDREAYDLMLGGKNKEIWRLTLKFYLLLCVVIGCSLLMFVN